MTEQEIGIADPFPPVPPEWVRVAELPRWIERCYDLSGDHITTELILSVRSGELRHRIPGIKGNYSSLRTPSLPPGLENQSTAGTHRTFVTDWDAADVDWSSGTVGGWTHGGARERLPIEVSWQTVETFAALRLRRWKRTASSPLDATPPSKSKERETSKRGRPPGSGKYPEDAALIAQAAELLACGRAKSNYDAVRQVAGDPNGPSYQATVERLRKAWAAKMKVGEKLGG